RPSALDLPARRSGERNVRNRQANRGRRYAGRHGKGNVGRGLKTRGGLKMRGSIRERSPGRWAIILDVIKDGTRKRKWHSFEGTKREAQKECARLIAAMSAGTYIVPSKTTLAAYLDVWLADIKSRVTPKTHVRYSEP